MRKTGRKKIGLALGSGGFRGLAHIGVIKVLEKNGIPIDYIAGSSAGAIVGGIYSAHRDIQKVEEIVNTLNLKELVGAFSDPYFKEGIFKGEQLMRTIKKYIGDFQIEETQIPFKAVATEMRSGKMIVIDKGNLAEAATASSSMPIVFKPFSDKATSLVDGGISCQVPAKIVRDMGADIVIAVNLMDNIAPDYYRNRISFVQHYILLLFHSLAQENIKEADIVLSPTFRTESWLEHMKNPQTLINEGERVATLALSRIRPLINPQNY